MSGRSFIITMVSDEFGEAFPVHVQKKHKWLNPVRRLFRIATHKLTTVLTREEVGNLDNINLMDHKPKGGGLDEPVETVCVGSVRASMSASDDWTIPTMEE